ncbi:MAG: hypothetical protein ACXVB9_07785 [Bdellovibrionota bacterium]
MKLNSALILLFCLFPVATPASYSPSPELLGSPVLLADYAGWLKNSEAFSRNGTETRAYQDLVEILYDHEIDRDWGSSYFPEANQRLEAVRAKLCPSLPFCSSPKTLASETDLQALANSLLAPATRAALGARWNVAIDPVVFPHTNRTFDLIVSSDNFAESESASYWDLNGKVSRTFAVPLISDTDTYLAGFDPQGSEFSGQFAFTGDKILLNDWQIRSRAMEFAQRWKFTLNVSRTNPLNPIIDAEAIQLLKLYGDNAAEFSRYYERLLPQTASSDATHTRFLKERAGNNFPEEVYQRVAYDLLSGLLRTQTAYFDLARRGGRENTSERQKALESLLTLQRYSPASGMFLFELSGLSEPLGSHGAVLDETIDQSLASTFCFENLKAILGLDVYADAGLFPKLKYAVLVQELFDAYYLQQRQPRIYEELKQPDGGVKLLASLPPADQLRLLRAYLVTPDGKTDSVGIYRMTLALMTHIQETDLCGLADLIHAVRGKNFR